MPYGSYVFAIFTNINSVIAAMEAPDDFKIQYFYTENLVSNFEDAIVNMNLFVVNDEYLEDDVIEMENFSDLNDEWVEESNEIAPEIGMKFKDPEAFEFYRNYACLVSFLVRRCNLRKGDDELVRNVTFTCSRESRRTSNTNTFLKPRATIQTGCKVMMTDVSTSCSFDKLANIINMLSKSSFLSLPTDLSNATPLDCLSTNPHLIDPYST
ncbi:FAR1-related sequence 11 [Abeliophyllum distichum]|uniref:FAR1-related sequence 11 n=1 Tax=Abeliophyllum distichum TaxID=126358 RepID=A0ABD1Q8Z2_9LAMI